MKKESSITTFIKGFIIGLGIIFPISASVLAIVMGMYEKLLNIINHFFKSLKDNFKFILWMVLGVIASVIVSCLLLDYTLNKFPVATLLFFIGLIIGGMPVIVKKTNKEYKLSNIIFMVLGIIILVGVSYLSGGKSAVITTSPYSLLTLFGVAVLGAGSMIVPGVSGSVMLVILGYYEPLLNIVSSFIKMESIWTNGIIIAVFCLGMLLGVILFSKLMAFLLKKFEIKTYFVIIGFVCASIINVIISLFNYKFVLIEFLIGVVLFILGFILSFKYLKEE